MSENKNCMFIAATKFLGFKPPSLSTGEVHEEEVIDLAIQSGMCPVKISLFPVSCSPDGRRIPVFTEEEARARFMTYYTRYEGIIIGKRNGVMHADTDIENFDAVERAIFNMGVIKS